MVEETAADGPQNVILNILDNSRGEDEIGYLVYCERQFMSTATLKTYLSRSHCL